MKTYFLSVTPKKRKKKIPNMFLPLIHYSYSHSFGIQLPIFGNAGFQSLHNTCISFEIPSAYELKKNFKFGLVNGKVKINKGTNQQYVTLIILTIFLVLY